ncbi:hypothetical protein NDU88_004395 [Pleurodeles waltl]|uniref:Uncharacterized protein n=1 Tax=Pleurodeles waltl TaxID=8319 RepID=A0AAV7PCD5_PLEWA|nr:hypothetical protein NDU88_004395 [Pleurodeles waltl]
MHLARGSVSDRRGTGAGEEPTASESVQRLLRLSAHYLGRAQNWGPAAARRTPWGSGGSPPARLGCPAAPVVCDCGIPLHGLQRLGHSCCCTVTSLMRMQAGPTRPPLLQ